MIEIIENTRNYHQMPKITARNSQSNYPKDLIGPTIPISSLG